MATAGAPSHALTRSGLRWDALLAAVLALGSAALVLITTGPVARELSLTFYGEQIAILVGLVVVQALILAVRRARPRTCLVAVVVLQLAIAALVPAGVTVRLAAPLVAAYTIGVVLRPWPRALGWVAAVAATEVVITGVVGGTLATAWFGVTAGAAGSAIDTVINAVLVAVLYGAAAVGGLWISTRRDNQALLAARAAAELQAERDRAERAVEAERRRMARELHDVATHHLTGLVVQAAAVERLIDRDPGRAREAAHSLRTQGKDALANLRSVVGVLRETDPQGDHPSTPEGGLDRLDDLVDTAQQLGDHVDLVIDGTPYALAPMADLSAYRIVQESLTNARRHAPGAPVTLHLAYAPDGVRVDVINPLRGGPAAPGGYGVVGMRERAQLAGGTLEAGPTDGTWQVRLILPRSAS